MGLVIGMDEAGYGPNLGPLVLTATVWEVPGRPQQTNFWKIFADIAGRERISSENSDGDDRLHVADSKDVYCPAAGLGSLEKSVLAAVGVASRLPASLHELLDDVGRDETDPIPFKSTGRARELWFADDADLPLPFSEDGRAAERMSRKWKAVCESTGVRLRTIRSDVVTPRRWNHKTRETENKATALSQMHLRLLRSVWDPNLDVPTMILADKHGGRNCYAPLLADCLDGQMVWCGRESRNSSVYRVGPTELRFEARAERHFPVALASMVSKYVRELSMELFNRFWRTHLPTMKPTHGYPIDARRFRKEVAEVQSRLEIPDEMFWRER